MVLNKGSLICVTGSSGVGKTTWCANLIHYCNDGIFDEPVVHVTIFYKQWQSLYNLMRSYYGNFISFEHGLPSEPMLMQMKDKYNAQHQMIIIDDMSDLFLNSDIGRALAVDICHHSNITCVYITHALFNAYKNSRIISQNTKYFIIFRNHRDSSTLRYLSSQVWPSKPFILNQAYDQIIEDNLEPFTYFIINLHNLESRKFLVLSNIFPFEFPMCCYIPQN